MSFFKSIPALSAACLISASTLSAQDSQPASAPASDAAAEAGDQMSMIIGYQIGQQMTMLDLEFNEDEFKKGMKLVQDGEDFPYSDEEMMEFQMKMQQIAQNMNAKKVTENKAKADAFLAQNKSKDGVMTTDSGLQYKVLEEGEGESPTAQSTVTVHYKGTLEDGTEFDSSYSRGEPAEFPLRGVIPAWTEGVQLMKPGAKYRLFVPPNLGYGENGSAPTIEPNSLLIFDIELISFDG